MHFKLQFSRMTPLLPLSGVEKKLMMTDYQFCQGLAHIITLNPPRLARWESLYLMYWFPKVSFAGTDPSRYFVKSVSWPNMFGKHCTPLLETYSACESIKGQRNYSKETWLIFSNIIYSSSLSPWKLIISQLTSQGMFYKTHFWECWLTGNFDTCNFFQPCFSKILWWQNNTFHFINEKIESQSHGVILK